MLSSRNAGLLPPPVIRSFTCVHFGTRLAGVMNPLFSSSAHWAYRDWTQIFSVSYLVADSSCYGVIQANKVQNEAEQELSSCSAPANGFTNGCLEMNKSFCHLFLANPRARKLISSWDASYRDENTESQIQSDLFKFTYNGDTRLKLFISHVYLASVRIHHSIHPSIQLVAFNK